MTKYSRKEYLQCYWGFIKPYLSRQIIAIFCVLLSSLAGLTSPYLMKLMLDHALGQGNLQLMYILIGVSLGVLVLQNMLMAVQDYLFGYISNRLGYDLRMALFEKILQRDVLFFQKKNVGEFMSRILQEVRDVLSLFSTSILRILTALTTFVGTLAFMWHLNWQLTIISCLSIPLLFVTMSYFNPRLKQRNKKYMELFAESSNVLQENLQGIGILKNYRKERYGMWRFSKSLHNLINSQMKLVFLRIMNMQALAYIYAIAPLILLLFGGKMVISGVLTIGSFVAFYSYVGRLFGPVRSLTSLNVELQQTLVAFYRFYDLLHTIETDEQGQKKVAIQRVQDEIQLKNITFAYEEGQEKLLEDFSISFCPGQMIGISGRNGIGKSTLFGLMTGMYQPSQGEVSIDGHLVKEIKTGSLQKMYGIMPQESYMFNMSIIENIALGRRNLSAEKIDQLAELLNIKEFVESLPNGYESMAEKNGENFSGGQKQKFGIMRALVEEPQILILDEATSAIDAETEEAFFEWLAKNKGDKIILYISHKAHLLKYADRIIRFEGVNNVVVEDCYEMIS